jgi:hypothetical protein
MGLLRELFGPSRDEIWGQLAREMNAAFEPGGFWGTSVVRAQYRQWIVTLDTYTVSTGKSSTTYTRIRAPFVNRDGFRFEIYRRNFFTGFLEAFGMEDARVGVPVFDDEFVIQGTDHERLSRLFSNWRIRDLVEAQERIHLVVKDDEGWFGASFPEGVDELYFAVAGVITDLNRLKWLFMLFAETLDELCRMGSAYEGDPGVRL